MNTSISQSPSMAIMPVEPFARPALSLAAKGVLAVVIALRAGARAGETVSIGQIENACGCGIAEPLAELFVAGELAAFGQLASHADSGETRVERTPWRLRPGVVYYLRRADGAIKIGFSAHLRQRLKPLLREYGKLTILATEPGDLGLEAARHDAFADLHLGREWFRAAPRLERHVARIAA